MTHVRDGVLDFTDLSGRLTPMDADQSALSRYCADGRVLAGLSEWLGEPVMAARMAIAAHVIELDLACLAGRLVVAFTLRDLPIACALAAALPVAADRVAAFEALLADVLAFGATRLPGLRIEAVRVKRQTDEAFVKERRSSHWHLASGWHHMALCAADQTVLQQLADPDHTPAIPPGKSRLAGLRIPTRLVLMVRHWQEEFIATLSAGDIVLADRGHAMKGTYRMGSGMELQAQADVSLAEDEAIVTSEWQAAPEHEADVLNGVGQNMELPVSFEIDAARIALADLNAMRPGYAIDLGVPLSQAAVRLTCHGQVIGEGVLVAVGDMLGVRIDRIGKA